MKKGILESALLSIPLLAMSQKADVNLAWNHVTNANVLYYNVYSGTNSGIYVNRYITTKNKINIPLVLNKTNYFTATAVNNLGESINAKEVNYIMNAPLIPTLSITPSSNYNQVTFNAYQPHLWYGFDYHLYHSQNMATWDYVGDVIQYVVDGDNIKGLYNDTNKFTAGFYRLDYK